MSKATGARLTWQVQGVGFQFVNPKLGFRVQSSGSVGFNPSGLDSIEFGSSGVGRLNAGNLGVGKIFRSWLRGLGVGVL